MAKAEPLTMPMSLEEARATIWPFREIKGYAFGKLWDDGLISLKDLEYAAQRAREKQVRDAAITLMRNFSAQSQDKPDGPLNVFETDRRSFSERRQIQLSLLSGVIIGVLLGIWILVLIQLIFFRSEPDPQNAQRLANMSSFWQITIIGTAIAILLGSAILPFMAVNWLVNRWDRQMELHRKGQLGEERVLHVLYHVLDGNWWLFRNLELPGQRAGDIDLVLVGSKGILALEVKAFEGEFRNMGERWERLLGNRWLPASINPTRQARRHAAALSDILKTHNINQWVKPVIVWANPLSSVAIENPATPVWQLNQVASELNDLQPNSALSDEKRKKIIEVFKSLYQEPFSAEDMMLSEV